jgi:leader peptidase (prepilin peptidase)/N-methyltransferase
LIDLLATSSTFLVICTSLLGLLIGSFLNVVIHRLPVMTQREWQNDCAALLETKLEDAPAEPFNLVTPRSRCPNCGHAISAIENIPLLSYAILGGKCRGCKKPISARYPFVELLSGVTAAAVVIHYGFSPATVFALALTWSLIVLAAIDFDTQWLFDSITLPMLWLGLVVNYFGIFVSLEEAVLGAVFGYLALWSVYWGFKLATGKEGMGYGDFKLLAMLGAWLGWKVLPVIIVLSSVVGACIGIGLMVFTSHDRSKPIPFGPYLAIAGWIALLWGGDIMARYLYGPGAL